MTRTHAQRSAVRHRAVVVRGHTEASGRSAEILELQRTAGNAAVSRLIQIQRYQAGETGHGGIEQRALTSKAVGMTSEQASGVYFGNWLRDLSQLPPKALPLINVLALGEFGREVTQADLGTYVPSEHLDNPEGGGTVEDPRVQALEHSTDPDKRNEFEEALAKLSPDQRKAYDDEQAHRLEITEAAKKSGLPEYIERGKFHSKVKLAEAVNSGPGADRARRVGDALHAVEDYFSHSNFVEAAIWTLYHDGASVGPLVDKMAHTTLGTNAALVGGMDAKGHPKIITGTYAPGANDWVSRFELLKTEIEHGQLTRAFILGWLRRNGIKGEEVGRRLGTSVGETIGGDIGMVAGGVSGAVSGAAEGAEKGWQTHSGFSAITHAVTGFFSGGAAGMLSGGESGYEAGAKEGRAVGSRAGASAGYAIGEGVGAIEEVLGAVGITAFLAAFPEITVAMAGLIAAAETDVVAEHETTKSAEQAKERGLSGPTHSQIAHDAPDNKLFAVSVQLAEAADRDIGARVQAAWRSGHASQAEVDEVTALVDKYVSPPEHDGWWKPIVLAAAAK